MPERDGYIPGVPCWIDTNQPDPEAALRLLRGLFGWEFEDVMPAESPGNYYIGRIRGGDVAAVGSAPEGAPPVATWNTYIQVDSADEAAAKARCGRHGGGRAVRRHGCRPDGRRHRSGGRVVLCLGAEEEQRRDRGQRARLAGLQRPGDT